MAAERRRRTPEPEPGAAGGNPASARPAQDDDDHAIAVLREPEAASGSHRTAQTKLGVNGCFTQQELEDTKLHASYAFAEVTYS
jgi:hypothetical protein